MVRLPSQSPPVLTPVGPVADISDLRVGVHDSSRVEWAVTVALPEEGKDRDYEIAYTVEIPANLYAAHIVWDQKQTFTRLTSPSEEGEIQIERGDMDELRRDALGVAHRVKMLRKRIERACQAAAAPDGERTVLEVADEITEYVTQAVEIVEEMRRLLDRAPSDKSSPTLSPDAAREWRLADEFLSHHLLDFLGGVDHVLSAVLLGPGSRLESNEPVALEELRCLISEALSEELVHRQARGFLAPSADSPAQLARFVERGSQLKKHFHGVLFLDAEAWMTDHRLRNWTGIVAASIAASFWLAFTLLPIGQGTRAGIGLGTFGVLFALSYALKDRIKEITRGWLTGRLTALYGQRTVRLTLPAHVAPNKRLLAMVRETFDCVASTAPDVLNRHVGNPRKVILLTFRMKVQLHGAACLMRAGIHSIKHVFRYDMTPIFSRLDDAVRPVPVLDPKTRRVRFAEAPKHYRLPLRVTAHRHGKPDIHAAGELVVCKRGIERLEAEHSDD